MRDRRERRAAVIVACACLLAAVASVFLAVLAYVVGGEDAGMLALMFVAVEFSVGFALFATFAADGRGRP